MLADERRFLSEAQNYSTRAWRCVSRGGNIAARPHAVQLSDFLLSRVEVAFKD